MAVTAFRYGMGINLLPFGSDASLIRPYNNCANVIISQMLIGGNAGFVLLWQLTWSFTGLTGQIMEYMFV